MGTMVNHGKELIRICPTSTEKIEMSPDGGRCWCQRYYGSPVTGHFSDLMDNGNELLGSTSEGLFVSHDDGRTWSLRRR